MTRIDLAYNVCMGMPIRTVQSKMETVSVRIDIAIRTRNHADSIHADNMKAVR
jgi:hypothetical protein